MSRRSPLLTWRVPAVVALTTAALGGLLAWAADRDGPPPPRGPAILRYGGVNFAGAEFNPGKTIAFKHYIYPDAKVVSPFVGLGFNAARLPVRWERLQVAPFGDLDPAEMKRVDGAIKTLAAFQLIILDIHNYARHRGKLLNGEQDGAMLADLWARLAKRYKNNDRVAFGIMNEPFGIGAAQWRAIAEQSVSAIRGAGARNLILLPGTRWSGAHSWGAGGASSNAAAWEGFVDPGDNFVIEMHQYLDGDSSGTKDMCVTPEVAGARLEAASQWLREQHFRGFLGEFGAAPNKECLEALDSLMKNLDKNSDVWLGWTYWAAGAWWGTYSMSIQPGVAGPKPQTAILLRHLPGTRR